MMKLIKRGVVLLALLVAFGGLGVLTGLGPAAYAQDEEHQGKGPSGLLALLAGGAIKDPQVEQILMEAGIAAPAGTAVTDAFMKQFGAVGLDTNRKIYEAIAEQSRWQTIMQGALKGVITELGGDLSKVEDDIVSYVPELTGFRITALEQIPPDNVKGTARGFVEDLDDRGEIPTNPDDAYWNTQVDPYITHARGSLLGGEEFEAIGILARTIGAFTGNTSQEVIDGQVDESTIAAISGISEAFKQFLNAALRRVRSLFLTSLARRVDQLTAALAQADQQLDTIQRELKELRQRRDPMPFWLAIAALVLAAGALGLALRRRTT